MAHQLNDQIAKRVPCPDDKHHVIHWDSKLKGFGLRVTAKGARSWIVDYRCNGRQRRLTIGSIEEWGCGAARDEARLILRDASRGIDRMDQRNAARGAPIVQELWNKYDQGKLQNKTKRRQVAVRTMWIRDVLPAIGNRKVANVTADDIQKLHRKITDCAGPVKANRTIENVHFVFNLAIEWGWIEKNPAARFDRNPEHPRERYLTPKEIIRLHQALNNCANRTGAEAIQILILTGARKGEVLNMRWDQLDLDNGIWLKPPNMTKQRRVHRVVLNGPAIALLRRRYKESKSEWVFPGDTGKPLTKFNGPWIAACKEAGLVGLDDKPTLHIHDLRHSFASVLAAQGYSLKIIGDMLGHSQPQTTNRYAHLLDEVQRAAADRVGALIEGERQR